MGALKRTMTEQESALTRDGEMAAAIYERLRGDILSGRLGPGTHLSQLTIARENGISRGPVREAMNRLQHDQLVIGQAHRRFTVAPFDIPDLESILTLHIGNMALAIRVSVPRLGENEIAALDLACGRMESTVEADRDAWEGAYREFALTLIAHAGKRIVALVASLLDNIQRYRANLLDRFPRVYAGGEELRAIVEAARQRNAAEAAALFVQYMGRISSLIVAGAAPLYDAERLRIYIGALTQNAETVRAEQRGSPSGRRPRGQAREIVPTNGRTGG